MPTALITGGHAGIGYEAAKQLAVRSVPQSRILVSDPQNKSTSSSKTKHPNLVKAPTAQPTHSKENRVGMNPILTRYP